MQSANRQFTEVQLLENMDTFKNEFNICLNSLHGAIEKYKEDLSIRNINSGHNKSMSALWPEKYGMEGIKIKRYLANDVDMFDWHVDVSDGQSNARFLAFFVYLDDNEAGSKIPFNFYTFHTILFWPQCTHALVVTRIDITNG